MKIFSGNKQKVIVSHDDGPVAAALAGDAQQFLEEQ